MKSDKGRVDQRSGQRVAVDQMAELLSADGTPYQAALLNISGGGGQVALTPATARALGLPQAPTLPFRLWLPGDAEALPLQGDAHVAYCVPTADGAGLLLGLEFGDLLDGSRRRIDDFITTCLRYAE